MNADDCDSAIPPANGQAKLVLIERELGLAVQEALDRHRVAGNAVAEWREGRVQWVAPWDIPAGFGGGGEPAG